MVPKAGLEPARLTPPPPQDGVSTNSTTSAILIIRLCLPFKVNEWQTPQVFYSFLPPWLLSTGTGIEFTGTLVC